jgi:hypothetical protein
LTPNLSTNWVLGGVRVAAPEVMAMAMLTIADTADRVMSL